MKRHSSSKWALALVLAGASIVAVPTVAAAQPVNVAETNIVETSVVAGGAVESARALLSTGAGELLGVWAGGGLLLLTGGAVAVAATVRRSKRAH